MNERFKNDDMLVHGFTASFVFNVNAVSPEKAAQQAIEHLRRLVTTEFVAFTLTQNTGPTKLKQWSATITHDKDTFSIRPFPGSDVEQYVGRRFKVTRFRAQ